MVLINKLVTRKPEERESNNKLIKSCYALLLCYFIYFFRDCYSYANRNCSAICNGNGNGNGNILWSVTTSLLQLVIRVTILIAAEEKTVTTLYNLHSNHYSTEETYHDQDEGMTTIGVAG